MVLDLTRVQGKVADLVLTDRCTIWRDPDGTRDDTLTPDGLSFDDGIVDEWDPVETDLACSVKWVSRYTRTGESGEAIVISEYLIKFGLPFENVADGDRIEITAISHDQRLLGKTLKVIEVTHGSLIVLRKVRAQLREKSVDIP